MASTSKKGLKDKRKASTRRNKLKQLNSLPTIKNVDIEAIKEEFKKNKKSSPSKKDTKETPKAEVKDAISNAEETVAQPVEEKKPAKNKVEEDKAEEKAPKKAAPKKKAPAAKKEKESPKEDKKEESKDKEDN